MLRLTLLGKMAVELVPNCKFWKCAIGKIRTVPAIAFFLLERRERERATDRWAVADATIHITYREISFDGDYHSAVRGTFVGSYHAHANTISLTSGSLTGGGVFVDPMSIRGNRFGTYLMNEVVRWAKRWPQANVNTISLLEGQSHGENRERRNRFYEQFGLMFEYTSPERKVGASKPMPTEQLVLVETWKENISEHSLPEFLGKVLTEKNTALNELAHRGRAVKELITERRRIESKPLRWALRQHASKIFWLGVSAIVIGIVRAKLHMH